MNERERQKKSIKMYFFFLSNKIEENLIICSYETKHRPKLPIFYFLMLYY